MDGKTMSVLSTYALLAFFISLSGFSGASPVEREATRYIVLRVLPSDPALATSLLTALLRSNPSSLKPMRHLLGRQGAVIEREQSTTEDLRSKRRDMLSFLKHVHRSRHGDDSSDNNNVDTTGELDASKDSVAYASGRAAESLSDISQVSDVESSGVDALNRRGGLSARREWKPPRLAVPSKRSLGRCIHRCINGSGKLNFIQCKSMCH
ncbi:hypothetical protein EGW08_007419 [Elysia chlorotica]|uniref:Uncharacterized protein n=1 Tax=Elysia chlorotica TaxID=188477 RepID=A0A3S1A7V2_ELYCH|nr:hypothetical protein EGW08_007419 [Elysia chlorotica]